MDLAKNIRQSLVGICNAWVDQMRSTFKDDGVLIFLIFVPLLFLSGMSWPQSAIPEFWQWVSTLFLSTFGIRGFVRMNTMGALLGDIKVEYIALRGYRPLPIFFHGLSRLPMENQKN